MVETFIALACAHLCADFLLQPSWLIRRKRKLAFLFLHIAIVTVLTSLFLGSFNPYILGVIAVTHAFADYMKAAFFKDRLGSFLADQAFHFTVIAGLAVVFPSAFSEGAWSILSTEQQMLYIDTLLIISGFIAAVPAGAYTIEKFMETLTARHANPDGLQVRNQLQGLPNGGFIIGCLERSIIYVLVVSGQAVGVGFLIAAKSLLRFGEISNSRNREIVEYIIIGTFASFGWSLLIASLIEQSF